MHIKGHSFPAEYFINYLLLLSLLSFSLVHVVISEL